MDDARGRDAWGRASMLAAAVLNAAPFRKGPGVKPDDLNPYARRGEPRKAKPVVKVGVDALRWLFCPNVPDPKPAPSGHPQPVDQEPVL